MSRVDRQPDNPGQAWQRIDARVLGQILAAQNMVFALPDTTRIAEFYAQTLASIPGIAACRVCLGNQSIQAGDMASNACAECESLRHSAGENKPLILVNSNVSCSLAAQPDMRTVAINSYQHHFGSFAFKLKDAVVFDMYQPFISNLSNYVAITLENRLQKDLLHTAHAELEHKVQERTHDLLIANEALDAARLAALNIMHEAVDARRRAEQSNVDLKREVAERQRAEAALHQAAEEIRDLYNHAPCGYHSLDKDGVFVRMNETELEWLGYRREEVIGQMKFADLVTASGAKLFADNFPRFKAAGVLRDLEFELIRKDGSLLPVVISATAITDRDGNYLMSRSTVYDTTERKRAENEIRKFNQELEQRVADRTIQLAVANQELEAFAYSVSHDLRAPLRHIDGFLELLQHRVAATLDEQSQHYLSNIATSARRMGQLIDDLLSFSRMGRHELAQQVVDLNDLVQEIIHDFEPETRGRLIHWRIADLPLVTGDRAMLRVVLVNLLSNALKFTRARPQADIEIGCEVGSTAEEIIYIHDNGVGFDMTYADKLYGVFQRLHRVDEFEGTGIGLANVRRVISRHGGRTWAHGAVNQGATFYFSLPRRTQTG